MSRCLTLEEYLERFVNENTRSAHGEGGLLVTDEEAQTLGFFLINGLTSFVEYVRLERADERNEEAAMSDERDQDEFIN